jgi:hypothetical protein
MSFLKWLRERALKLQPRDTNFDKLGVRADPGQRPGLEAIVEAFRQGYNLALDDDDLGTLNDRMARAFEPQFCGFAHEGVGMCLTLLDFFKDRQRVERYFPQCAGSHDYLLVLGVGFALARLPWVRGGVETYARRVPPGFDGLVMNGYGFHEGCFKSGGYLERVEVPDLTADGARCFDHGLGRALWFICGASPERITQTLSRIPTARHPDLWAGLGTACCYAGRAYTDLAEYDRILTRLDEMVGPETRAPFHLGVILAAMLQVRAKNPTQWVQRASEFYLKRPSAEVGVIADRIWNETAGDRGAAKAPYMVYKLAGERMMAEIGGTVLRQAP